MPTPLRFVVALVVVLAITVLAGCGGAPSVPGADGAGKKGIEVTLAPNTCWNADELGADPQAVLALSKTFNVNYFDAAHALDGRPAFTLTEACGAAHHVEVYKVVAVSQVNPVVTSYATLLQPELPAYRQLSTAMRRACMNKALAKTADQTKLRGAIAGPAFPDGVQLGWAPPSPEQWERGQRVYACTLRAHRPVTFLYAAVFTKAFPTSQRTCIDNKSLSYVDCSRKHDREKIAVIDVRAAVTAGKFPGRGAIRVGPDGRYVDVAPAVLAVLDKACTSYLKSVSTTKKLTGIAEIDADQWPAADGSYPVVCEADTSPTKKTVVTKGSVYNKK